MTIFRKLQMTWKTYVKSAKSMHNSHLPNSQPQSQSQCETCIAPLTKLDSGAEQNNILKHTIKIKKKNIVWLCLTITKKVLDLETDDFQHVIISYLDWCLPMCKVEWRLLINCELYGINRQMDKRNWTTRQSKFSFHEISACIKWIKKLQSMRPTTTAIYTVLGPLLFVLYIPLP